MLRVLPSESALVGDLPVLAAPALPAHLPMSAARKVAALKKASLLLAERDGRLVGVVDERALMSAADDSAVGDVMKRLDHCLTPAMPIVRARELLLRTGADALPVVAGAFLLGVVTRAAIERAVREPPRRDPQPARRVALPRRRDAA
ncbi:MAG TPA: CBS domain-containing protein [Polyangia bacterium]|nr:CBS domain-containing protein [Polyangia bacterium]